MNELLDGGIEDNEKGGLHINKAYAEKYSDWRRKEELSKLKDKYGGAVECESEESSSDDEIADWTENEEESFLKTLAALKSKDPKIYESEKVFFKTQVLETKQKGPKKEKPMFLKDFERDLIVKKDGHYEESDSDSDMGRQSPSYVQQQIQLKKSLTKAVEEMDNSDEDLFVERVKSNEEKKEEKDEYLNWLKGHKSDKKNNEIKELKSLKKFWQDPALAEGEQFLRDYILDKKYAVENDESTPTYKEIVNEPISLEDDELELEREEEFEKKFNFRFEEPNATEIKSYPRKIEESVRRPDDKRSDKRKVMKERKELEKQQRREEIKLMKDMTRQEIMKKVDQLRKVTGDNNLTFDMDDLKADFDPAKYDAMMQTAFSEEYYSNPGEEEKPVFSDLDNDGSDHEDVPDYDHINIDVSELKTEGGENKIVADSEKAPTSSRRAEKRKNKFIEAVQAKKPLFNPGEMTLEQYVDKYYKLNYEDVRGDTVFRFKYRSVPANDFGLTDTEMLLADDKELNAWVSLKKTSQFRNEKEEEMDRQIYKKKGLDREKKKKILPSVYSETSTFANHTKLDNESVSDADIKSEKLSTISKSARRKIRKKKKTAQKVDKTVGVSRKALPSTAHTTIKGMTDERLKAYGLNPKKTKNRSKYKK